MLQSQTMILSIGAWIGIGIPSLLILIILVWYIIWRISEKSHPFNAYTTSTEAINGMNLTGKVAIVTGANSGIGKETAKILAQHGCLVIMACRSQNKGESAIEDIVHELENKQNSSNSNQALRDNLVSGDAHQASNVKQRLILMKLDLSSLQSVLEFSEAFTAKYEAKENNINGIDYLINNAGIMALPEYRESTDGFEMQFATNHLGHWYLVELLSPILKATAVDDINNRNGARIINLSSYGQYFAKPHDRIYSLFSHGIEYKTFMGEKKSDYDDFYNYGISKLCNLLHARTLHSKYKADGIIAVSVHPGTIQTNLSNEMHAGSILKFGRFFFNPQYYMEEMKSIPQGAATTLRCVSMANSEIKGGHWYFNCRSADDRDRLYETAKEDKEKYNNRLADRLDELSRVLVEAKGFKLNLS